MTRDSMVQGTLVAVVGSQGMGMVLAFVDKLDEIKQKIIVKHSVN